jgi:hypothetical protein
MRKLALLTVFAAAALFFGAPESAFAHPNHHPVQQTQSASAPDIDITAAAVEHFDEFVSVAYPQADKCPHGQAADCDFCCACAGAASVALATQEILSSASRVRSEPTELAMPYEIRQAVLDLSRPPKTFA